MSEPSRLITTLWIGLLLAVVLTASAWGRQMVITTTAGTQLTGELVSESTDTVTIRIEGIKVPIARADIKNIDYKKDIQEIYAQRRGELDDDDIDGRYRLAYFLFEEKAYALAQKEIKELLGAFPDNEDVQRLNTVIENKLMILAQRAQTPPRPPRSPRSPRPRIQRDQNPDQTEKDKLDELLSDQQVNLIRIWELPADLLEAKPAITIPKDTVNKLFELYATHEELPKGRRAQNKFRALKGYQQLDLFFTLQARSLYPEIIVRKDPTPLAVFRRTINPSYVSKYLARYFGQGAVPQLKLFNRNPNQVNEAYTNFFILSQSVIDGLPMIDRDKPQRSLMLQWGLRREDAYYPAPEVPNWRPFFNSTEDQRFVDYLAWIESLFRPAPKYGIQYTPPLPGEEDQDDQKTPENNDDANPNPEDAPGQSTNRKT